MKKLIKFFDRLEDRVRENLSHVPLIYTIIGAFSIVLFWRGVWMTADMVPFLTGPVSILISISILLITGLFVSFFVGDVIILSGMKGEKKLIEKTESEIRGDETALAELKKEVSKIHRETHEVKDMLINLQNNNYDK